MHVIHCASGFVLFLYECLLILGNQILFGIHGGPATRGCSCYGLTVVRVADIATGKYTWHVGSLEWDLNAYVALSVGLNLREGLGVGLVTYGQEEALNVNGLCLTRLAVAQHGMLHTPLAS